MRYAWLGALVAVVAIAGCGDKTPADPARGSGLALGSGSATGTGVFDLLGVGDDPTLPLVMTSAGDRVTVFGGDGGVAVRTNIPSSVQATAHIVAHWLTWLEGKTLHVIDVRGGAAKTLELAEVPEVRITGVPAARLTGSSSVAFLGTGFELVDLATAKSVYRSDKAFRARYHLASHRYVVLEDRVHLVDEGGAEIWVTPIQIDGQREASLRIGTTVMVRSKTSYAALAASTGKVMSTGPIQIYPDELSLSLGKPSDGDIREYLRIGRLDKMRVVALDGTGKTLWTAPWPAELGVVVEMLESNEDHQVAFRRGATVALFDAVTGKPLRAWSLTPKSQLVGIRNGCAVMLDDRALSCTEPGGTVRWTAPIAGGDHHAWLVDNDTIVADGIPLHVSRIDRAGKLAWSTQLPNTTLDHDAIHDTATDRDWGFHPGLLLLATNETDQMIDLSTGKLVMLRHE